VEKGFAPPLGLSREEEKRLIALARQGDRRALNRLVTLLSGPVLRYGRAFCGNEPDAEDVAQVALEAVIRRLAEFRGHSALATWAYVVARNACRRRLRRERRSGVRLESLEAAGAAHPAYEVPDAGGDPGRDVERRELGSILERTIAELPATQREVVILRDVEGLRASEVARVLGLDVAAVKSRLHRARAALRRALEPYTGAPAAAPRKNGCPDTEALLSRSLEGEITPAACARLADHVAACPDCRERCAGLERALRLCREARRKTLPQRVARAARDAVNRISVRSHG
jgi:RNA polymerase sigma-70 factor (ECF subfamily)